MYITRLEPSYKTTLWGGNKLSSLLGKKCTVSTGESWELSCHPSGLCRIADGKYAGMYLSDVLKKDPAAVGKCGNTVDGFPLLVKFIDATKDLSVQVHPSDEYALKNGLGHGKTEMWYIIEAEEGARIGCGFKRNVSGNEIVGAARSGKLEELINYIPVKAGDAVMISAGTVHCIGSGIVLAEIQQSSDITYRLYDYRRLDANGKLRTVDLEHGVECADKCRYQGSVMHTDVAENSIKNIFSCPYFNVDLVNVTVKMNLPTHRNFVSLSVVDGKGKVNDLDISAGTTVFIPAGTEGVHIFGSFTALSAYIK